MNELAIIELFYHYQHASMRLKVAVIAFLCRRQHACRFVTEQINNILYYKLWGQTYCYIAPHSGWLYFACLLHLQLQS